MRIFALETDKSKIIQKFCHQGECVVLMTYYHGLSFLFAIIREIIITVVLIVVAFIAVAYGAPLWTTIGVLSVLWLIFVFFNLAKAWIDWQYDFILVTTDKVILVDQTSFFKQEIKPIHIENIGSVSTETQFWGIFPFGQIQINLKEGEGGDVITKRYVPRAEEVASKISTVVTNFQRGDQGKQFTNAPEAQTAAPQTHVASNPHPQPSESPPPTQTP